MVDLSCKLGRFYLQNPVMGASGTYGYNNEYGEFLDVSKLGAIVTKGITLEPREGNEGQRLFETASGMINRIGLENVGIDAFLKTKLPLIQKRNINYILNIAGSSIEDYTSLALVCNDNKIPAIEVNVSCPNVHKGCLEFGTEPQALFELICSIRRAYEGFLIVKLTPNVTEIEPLVQAVESAGADCISAINTVKGLGVDLSFDGVNFRKTFVQGGLSGKCIKPVALSLVNKIRAFTHLPIIGLGGIATMYDMLEFFAVGADALQVGTENFTHPSICASLVSDLEKFMQENNFETLDKLKEALRK